ncbi:LEA type 2 family protein [Leeia aquatica]|uniref:Water stress and hypersensitive response domain-containing protein n=1 Tax=Leeia aquatica TaxID=2725557 RepID=A0A847SDV9_9NEIS|nr:LEA type 2 family protein [Leeia aquatica]NLR75626.1 hypothetical protein [Leeia aquatica]
MRRLFLCVALLWLAGCASVPKNLNPPKVSLADIEFGDFGLLEQKMVLTLRLQNPNNIDIPLDGLTTQLEVNGQALAQGSSRERVTLPRLGEATVRLNVTSNLSGLIKQLRLLRSGQGQQLPYLLRGQAFIPQRSEPVPFEYQGELLPQLRH